MLNKKKLVFVINYLCHPHSIAMKTYLYEKFLCCAVSVTLLSITSHPLLAETELDYNSVTIGETEQTLYLSPLWLVSDGLEQQDNGDAFQSMTVVGDVIYISDASNSDVKLLRRYSRDNGSRLTDLAITYPSSIQAPTGPITHVGSDGAGALYVWSGLPDASSPVVDIDIVDPKSGEVTSRISHDLRLIVPERYVNITSIYLGHPQVTGSLISGNYELALTEIFSMEGSDNDGIRLWRIPMVDGEPDDPRASKLLLPNAESEGRIDAFIPFDRNARVAMIDGSKSIVDDGVNKPMYFRVRNLGVQVNSRLETSDGSSPEAKANGLTIFNWGQYRLLAYGNSVTGGSNFVVAHWKDTSSGINGDNIEKLWTIPKLSFAPAGGESSVTLSHAMTHEGNELRIDLYVYTSGSGLGAYAIGNTRYSGTTDLQEMKFDDPIVAINGTTVTLTQPATLKVVSIDGKYVMSSDSAVNHDLSSLPAGVYIIITSGRYFKIHLP